MTPLEIIPIPILSFVAWAVVLVSMSVVVDLSRVAFVAVHYLLDVFAFGIAFSAYYFQPEHLSPLVTSALTLVSIGVFEVIYWRFIYKGQYKIKPITDLLAPALLIFASVFLVGVALA